MQKEILLKTDDLHVRYGGVTALNGADIALDEGEVVALMGPNGAGKSTILKAIFGISPIHHGKVLWHGASVSPVSYEMVERGIAFVPQGRRVFTDLTVEENLEVGGYVVRDAKLIKERIHDLMEMFPVLKESAKRNPERSPAANSRCSLSRAAS
jgi:branched-chain amino acid transport system ATP-binding protein